MIQEEGRIVGASVAVFATLIGIVTALRGLLFDVPSVTWYGVLAVFAGATTFVVLLMPNSGDEP